jgi:hypothetical protein
MHEITLRLTDSQVAHICAAVGLLAPTEEALGGLGDDATSRLSALLASLPGVAEHKLSQSFVRGLFVLTALPSDGHAIGIVDLATSLEMSPSTVHRYVATLIAVGLAERNERTREYSRVVGAPSRRQLGA